MDLQPPPHRRRYAPAPDADLRHLWVFVLLPLPWLLRLILPARRQSPLAVRVPFGDRLREVLAHGSCRRTRKRVSLRWLMPCLIWVLLLTALARPQWIEPPLTKNLPTRDLLLLVDLSGFHATGGLHSTPRATRWTGSRP